MDDVARKTSIDVEDAADLKSAESVDPIDQLSPESSSEKIENLT